MKKIKVLCQLLLLLIAGVILTNCEEDVAPISVTSVTLNSTSMTLVEGDSQKLTATISPSNAENKMVLWISSDSSIATVEDGIVTAVKPGKATITAKSDDGGKTATCNVTVVAMVYPVEKVELDMVSATLNEGDTLLLTATIKPENATNKNVTWKSSNTSVATVIDGEVTAIKAGTTTITVTTEDGGKTATCEIEVNALVSSVSLNKSEVVLTEGDTTTLTVTINPENATNKNVTWSSSNTAVATVKDGVVMALKPGTTTITVTTEDGGKTATCKVTVNEKIYPVENISIDKNSATLFEGEILTLFANITPENATNKNVTWTSSDTSVAMVADGKVTALKAGTTTITVTTEDGGKTAICSITVNAKVSSISLDKTQVSLTEGDTTTLIATINPSNATNKNVGWSSSNTSVATVSNGKVTAVKAGTAIITVTTEDGGKTATCTVTVNENIYPVEGISLNQSTTTLYEGDSLSLTATISPSNATNKNVSWKSSNTSVATVSNGNVTAVKAGTATITVTTEDGGKTATCNVTVIAKVAGVSIDKSSATLLEGETITLTATINPSNATNKNVTWSSSNSSVASVSNGVVTALKAGTTTITVTTEDGGKTATCYVTVIAKVSNISLNKTSASLTEGDTLTLTATITPSNATNKNVTWSSSNSSVASVSNGVVTALKAGTATITVTTEDGGKTATCSITVNEKIYPVSGISLNKSTLTMCENENYTLTATITPSNATNKDVGWSSSNTSVATVSNGVITALNVGTTTITATTVDGGMTASCNITVLAKVTSVSLDKYEATLCENETITLTATISPNHASNKNVTWNSSNTSVASVSNGVVTALKAGTTSITVKTEDGGKTATCYVTVIAKVSNISLNKTSASLTEGDTLTLTATITPSNATNKNVTWKSSNTSVAKVSNGVVTALKAGSTTITVTTEDGAKTATCQVTVNAKVYPVTSVSLSKSSTTLTEGGTITLTATINPSNATNKNVTWSSSNSSVASVSNGVVTALKAGTTTITVTTEDGGKTAKCNVTVIAKVTSVSLDKTNIELTEGDVTTLTATIKPDNATNKNVTWSSSNSSIASVSNGKVAALAPGSATITVATEDGNKTATCLVTVKEKVNHSTTEPVDENSGIWTDNIDYIDEYGINHGHGVKIGSVIWAPVNCGYHATDYKYGKLYQWGRKYGQGYDTDATIPQLTKGQVSKTEGNLKSNENKYYYYKSDWVTPSDKELWNSGTESSPVKTESDPCPDGWRVPTKSELNMLIKCHSYWTANDADQVGYWLSGEKTYTEDVPQVFFPVSGVRAYSNGGATGRGGVGYYWSSTPSNSGAEYFFFNRNNVSISTGGYRANGHSVRCVKE